jgi:hypothetical protein
MILKTKRVLSLALAILIFVVAKAQSDFRPGYIITLQGDTINGTIYFRSDKANAKNCIFKKSADTEKVVYTPDQIKSYKFIDGKYYISSISMNYKFKDLVFLEYAIKGTVSIYYYQDDVKDHYFVMKDTTMIELNHQDRLTGNVEKDNLILSKPEKYKDQLRLLMQDQPSLFGNIGQIECNAKDLISVTKEYQKLSCPSQECIQFEKKTDGNLKFKLGMSTSIGRSYLSTPPYDITRSDYEETKYLDIKPVLTYGIGALLNMYVDYNGRNKLCFQLSPALNFVEYNSYKERTLSPLLYVYKLNIKYSTLRIPLLLKYSFYSSNRSIYPFVKFGTGYDIYLSQKGSYEYYSTPISGSTNQTSIYNIPLNKVSHSNNVYFVAGLGVDIKMRKNLLSIGANYTQENGPLNGVRSDAQFEIEFQF